MYMVNLKGLEPLSSTITSRRSNQLSYELDRNRNNLCSLFTIKIVRCSEATLKVLVLHIPACEVRSIHAYSPPEVLDLIDRSLFSYPS